MIYLIYTDSYNFCDSELFGNVQNDMTILSVTTRSKLVESDLAGILSLGLRQSTILLKSIKLQFIFLIFIILILIFVIFYFFF